MIDHVATRELVLVGFRTTFGQDPSVREAQPLQAVGYVESVYGTGWKGEGAGSNNMGAITAGPKWKGQTFTYRDSRPDPKTGQQIWYTTHFRKYATEQEGWTDLCRVMYQQRPSVLSAARSLPTELDLALAALADEDPPGENWPYAVSEALYDSGYYAGFGSTREARIRHHYEALRSASGRIARALGEIGPAMPPRTLSLKHPYMVGEDVQRVQCIVGATQDGVYGTDTKKLVEAWQAANGLKPDGIFGPKSRLMAKSLGLPV